MGIFNDLLGRYRRRNELDWLVNWGLGGLAVGV